MTSRLRQLAAAVQALRSGDNRVIIGIVGEPGSGKSTVAAALQRHLDCPSALVSMDGFHLSNGELRRRGLAGRKGAPDTFDSAGYVNLLRRLRDRTEAVVYAPAYLREIEEPVAGSVAVPAEVPVVITEGNYLLLREGPWAAVTALLDRSWFLECDSRRRLERLIERHVRFGKTPAQAHRWATGPDEANARVIRETRVAADAVIDIDGLADEMSRDLGQDAAGQMPGRFAP
ncbi:nucleoside/nucleotide kinase family protein [Mycolicibacterium palauense]|uniref:nucleoside/nucleotide kinase family protein n=1 Tax=Mycolicibacterium palauense TaxID=2034511 RepID=UPI000BFED7C4|nr:nucleoside/nucleotide kinase family protein [Mycolicibacterium palauense]